MATDGRRCGFAFLGVVGRNPRSGDQSPLGPNTDSHSLLPQLMHQFYPLNLGRCLPLVPAPGLFLSTVKNYGRTALNTSALFFLQTPTRMLLSGLGTFFRNVYIFTWDAWLTLIHLVTPPEAGERKWPEFVPPKEGDSRCACSVLNALANHGILPHGWCTIPRSARRLASSLFDERIVRFTDIAQKFHDTFNFAMTFSPFVTTADADTLHKNYSTGTCDLSDLDLHNGIVHDASLLRTPYIRFITELLALASGKDADGNTPLKRRADAKATNLEFQLDQAHKIFGSANSSTLLAIFGGRMDDLEPFLKEERIPEGWESRNCSRMGLTFLAFNPTTIKVERGIKEEPAAQTAEDKATIAV
ncbi:hypothetical protein B0H17DRAFT_1170248 [Mycena rosella]|uniref:Heme haloperoxidase family profile domain-containing protein n=1 Tax=Mycena rosella TaxID=1033263 RepID=A0AAD7D4Y0_MYCRO|nr:hypothetical protein B0H17DRAFT_1170248 [Mycena rosella]